ncbi:MAG: hypothetical protein LBU27_04575 [Candidatus Peribacteria bacterium]|jgi:hypothetical protein|nr:hypothetical protein [Candidatus Peribacteria bacterium]
MTRAKNNLILLGNSDSNPYFKELLGNASIKNNDTFPSDDPTEISLITSCSDVQL